MRIFVPGQGVTLPFSSSQFPSSGFVTLKDGTKGYMCTAIQGSLVECPSAFWDTDGRKMNNCLHSKLVVKEQPGESYRTYTAGNGYSSSGELLIFNGEYYSNRSNSAYDCSLSTYVLRQTEKDWTPIVVSIFSYMGARTNRVLPRGRKLNLVNGSSLGVTIHINVHDQPVAKKGQSIKGFRGAVSCNWSKTSGEIQLTVNTPSGHAANIPGLAHGTVIGSFPPSIAGNVFDDDQDAASFMRGLAEVYIEYISALIVDEILGCINAGDIKMEWNASKYWLMSDVIMPKVSEKNFILEEPMLVRESIPLTSNPLAGYWRNWLIQHAYVDACESVPVMSDNNISNIIEIVGFIKSLVVEHRIEIPRSLKDVWLSYRYSYSTTRSDVEEAIDFVHRYMDLGGLDRSIICHGQAQCEFQGHEVTCRCRFDIAPRELGYLEELWRTLYTYGLAPNFYVLWDSLPYSFMVDWFIPIGDMASVADAEVIYCGDTYDISNVCFSLQYTISGGSGYSYSQYSRWASKPLRMFNELYWLDKPAVRDRTLLFRVLDTVSLFVR